jgi:Xaa-Pro aminopeptidase
MSGAQQGPGRIVMLRKVMRERGIGALLVTRHENVRYLTGFTGSAGSAIIGPSGRPVLVTDFRYQEQAAAEAPGVKLLIQKKDHFSAIRSAAEQAGTGALWFDESSLTLDRVKALRKLKLQLRGTKDLVAELRQRKDASELALIRKAVRRAEHAFRDLLPAVKPGTTERELGLRLEMLIREHGSRRAAFDIIVASGKNGAMPHASASNRRLRSGDLVTFDFGAEADGYYSDITRTICVGRPTAQQREVYDLVLRAQKAAIQAAGPGIACASVDQAARSMIENAGRGKQFGHATGHGIGLMVHEAPAVSALSKADLREGMVFTVEPGVYIPGWGGVRIEDMVSVTGEGHQVLTGLSREL